MLFKLLFLSLLLSTSVLMAKEEVPDFQLEIRDASNQLIDRFLIYQHQWCLHWFHSVTSIAVEDCYRIESQQLLLSHSWQPDFAAGLGHYEGRGILSEHPKGGYLISAIDEPVTHNALWLRVGSAKVAHTLVSADTQLNLSQIAAGQRLHLQLKPLHNIE